jgi:methionine-rich copper-binding protein CopC
MRAKQRDARLRAHPSFWLVGPSLAGIFLCAALAASVPAVFAHADYERSVPGRDEVVTVAPTTLDVFFTQELFKRQGENFIRVFDESGSQVSDGDGIVDDDDRTHMSTALAPNLPNGRYIVEWQTLSDIDGDSDDGSFCFFVGAGPTTEQAAACAELAGDEEATASSAATAPAATSANTTPADGDEENDDDGGDSSAGVVIAVAIGGAVLAVIAAVGLTLWLRRSP